MNSPEQICLRFSSQHTNTPEKASRHMTISNLDMHQLVLTGSRLETLWLVAE